MIIGGYQEPEITNQLKMTGSWIMSTAWSTSTQFVQTSYMQKQRIMITYSTLHSKWFSIDNNHSLDSGDDLRSGCRNVSHHYRQQSF